VIAAFTIGAIAGLVVCILVGRIIARRRRRSGWPPSTAAQLRAARKLNLNDTNNNRWSSHR